MSSLLRYAGRIIDHTINGDDHGNGIQIENGSSMRMGQKSSQSWEWEWEKEKAWMGMGMTPLSRGKYS